MKKKKSTLHKRKFDVVIIGGLGHVGLPLGIMFAHEGLNVCLFDINAETAKIVKKGKMPFVEYGAEPILKKALKCGKLSITAKKSSIAQAETVIISVGTPVDEYLGPKVRPFMDVFIKYKPFMDNKQLIIIRSTVYPNTTRAIAVMLNKKNGPWHIAYCPERIVQGHAVKELKILPQLVAGVTKEAQEKAAELFGILSPKVLKVSVEEAELAKLFSQIKILRFLR